MAERVRGQWGGEAGGLRRVRDGFDLRLGVGQLAVVGAAALVLLIVSFLVGVSVGKGLGRAPLPSAQPLGGAEGLTFFETLTSPAGAAEPVRERRHAAGTAGAAAVRAQAVADEGRGEPAGAPGPAGAAGSGRGSSGWGRERAADVRRLVQAPAEGTAQADDLTAPRALPLPGGEVRPAASPQPPAPATQARAEAPKGSAATAPAGGALFTVQVGAFRTLEGAERLAARLAAKGYPVFVASVDLGPAGQGIWHRVRVGRFESRDAAEATASRLAAAEGLSPRVVRDAAVAEAPRGVDTMGVAR